MTPLASLAVALALCATSACTADRSEPPVRAPAEAALPRDAPSPAEPTPTASRSGDRAHAPEAWLLWTLGGLPGGLAGAIEHLPEIRRVTPVSSGTAWTRAWTGPGGRWRRVADGLAVPFEIAAVDRATYARFLPLRAQPKLRRLGPSEALVSGSAARVHGLERGSLIRFPGSPIRVKGVIPDADAGSHELLVLDATGRALGITTQRYLLAETEDDTSGKRVARAIGGTVPDDVPVRLRAPGEAAFLRHADLTLPQSRLKALFGGFAAAPAGGWFDVERSWVRRNIVEARVPILGGVTCHRRIVPLVRGALRELVRRGLGRLVDPAQYGGCYAPRFIGRDPGAGLSHHAWGVAIDINVADNPLGAEPTMDPRVVRTFERWGFVWGGDFIRPDGHHFEFRCFPERCNRR